MSFILQPWQFFFAILAGWVNREQEVIDYLRTENAVLKESHGPKHILLVDVSGEDWRNYRRIRRNRLCSRGISRSDLLFMSAASRLARGKLIR